MEPTSGLFRKLGFLLVFLAGLGKFAVAQSWVQLTPAGGPPPARIAHTAVMDPLNNMIVFGGFANAVGAPPLFNDVWVLSDADGSSPASTWTQLMPQGAAPAARAVHSAVYDPATNSMIVFGGNLSVGNCFDETNDLWALANANGVGGTPTWAQITPAGVPPTIRDGHSAVYDGASNRMIVFGGRVECSNANAEIWVLVNANGTGGTPTWTQLVPVGAGPDARAFHSAVYDPSSNRMIIFGGANQNLLNDVWVLANANGLGGAPTWTQLTPSGPLPVIRQGHSTIYDPVANTMTIFAGSTGSGIANDVWMLANANGLGGTPTWTQLQPTGGPPVPRSFQSAVFNLLTDRMTMFGGQDAAAPVGHNDTWVLTDANGTPEACDTPQGAWTAQSPLLAAHGGAATGVVNGKMYVASGIGSSTDVEVYDPAANTWSEAASFPAADGAAYALGAGVGSKFYVIGGCTTNADCRIGTTANMEIYDSTTNSWSSGPPMPVARSAMSGDVINGKIYVAGGVGPCPPCVVYNNLEVYDPSANTWTELAPMPTARASLGATAVNGKLYTVGGSVSVGTLEIYDPATNTWTTGALMPTPLAALGVGSAKGTVYAISGVDATGSTDIMEAYDPRSDTWTTAPSIPTARYVPQVASINGALYVAGAGAGNTAITTVEAFTPSSCTDSTPPTTSATQSPAPNAAGWNNTNVTVSFSSTDNSGGSGVKQITFSATGAQPIASTTVAGATASVNISSEGATTISYFATDSAGNVETAKTLTVQIDETAPTTTEAQSPAPNAAGWNNTNVTVSLSATDNSGGSGVQQITFSATGAQPIASTNVAGASATLSIMGEGVTTITYFATDNAGNVEAAKTLTIQLDKTPPAVSCGSPDGAWHASDVIIACTASDAGSGLDLNSPASFMLATSVPAGTETAAAFTGSRALCDIAGNCSVAGPVGPNKIDKKAPQIVITAPAATTYKVNQAVASSYTCSDGGSGVATCAGPVASGSNFDTASAGAKTFTVNSTDNVGNGSAQSVSYSVGYAACLLYDSTHAKKSGSTIPIKFQLCDALGNDVSSSGVTVTALQVVMVSTNASSTVDDAGNANPDSNFRFDPSLGPTGGYIFNLQTTGLSTGTFVMTFAVSGDPTTHNSELLFQVR